jgi:hypothetical protein
LNENDDKPEKCFSLESQGAIDEVMKQQRYELRTRGGKATIDK